MMQWYSTSGASLHPYLLHVSLGPPDSTTQTAFWLFQSFFHSSRQSVVGHAWACPLFPLRMGRSGPDVVHSFLGPPESIPQTAWSVQPFFCAAHGRASLSFTMGCPSPPQNCPSHGGSGSLSNTWFLGPTWPHNPNGILMGSTVFAWLTTVTVRLTDRQTDHATRSVTIGRI